MKKDIGVRVGDKILPYFVFPVVVGIVTGILIFIFKVTSSFVIHKSEAIYAFVRENPIYLPLLLVGTALIGLAAGLLLKYAKECRGGGIPTAVATVRGIIPIRWIQGIVGLFVSSMLTYLAGVPLGNEGPSVQMGTAAGKETTVAFGKKNRAFERYGMTGGASAGFAIATGSPLSGIVFALEELHRRFSPTVFIVAAVSVISGTVTADILSGIFGVDATFFDLAIDEVLPLKFIWVAAIIGFACGIASNLLTKFYRLVKRSADKTSEMVAFVVKIVIIFASVGLLGFISADFVGSGHSLIEKILHGHAVWYMILIAFLIRALLMLVANVNGVSGGLFVPTLALGAMIASLISDGLIALGVIGEEYYAVLIVIGIASFLAASSRIPLTALTFAAEALCVVTNMLPAAVGVIVAYLVVEILGVPSFTDIVIESKDHTFHRGKTPLVVNSHLSVEKGAFAVGMEIRDILWPYTCIVLSVKKANPSHVHSSVIEEGDILHIHYRTYDPEETMRLLTDILGDQPEDDRARIHVAYENQIVPET